LVQTSSEIVTLKYKKLKHISAPERSEDDSQRRDRLQDPGPAPAGQPGLQQVKELSQVNVNIVGDNQDPDFCAKNSPKIERYPFLKK
jgi:hypothetical protein